jgi:hypothetical protein
MWEAWMMGEGRGTDQWGGPQNWIPRAHSLALWKFKYAFNLTKIKIQRSTLMPSIAQTETFADCVSEGITAACWTHQSLGQVDCGRQGTVVVGGLRIDLYCGTGERIRENSRASRTRVLTVCGLRFAVWGLRVGGWVGACKNCASQDRESHPNANATWENVPSPWVRKR